MKFRHKVGKEQYIPSLPSRGAWIEIYVAPIVVDENHGRSPRGERGLKSLADKAVKLARMVAPLAGSVD